MGQEANYKLDQDIVNDYYGIRNEETGEWIQKPIKSYRKLAKRYSCSHENIRIRITRYEAFQIYNEIYSHLPTQLATILIKNKYKTAAQLRRATDEQLLAIKWVSHRWLEVIREAFPYENSNR
jgi:hypothetical protein